MHSSCALYVDCIFKEITLKQFIIYLFPNYKFEIIIINYFAYFTVCLALEQVICIFTILFFLETNDYIQS